jgi:hypothetical protein
MAGVSYGGLVLVPGAAYYIRVMDLNEPGSVAVRWFPEGLFLSASAKFVNRKDAAWTVRAQSGNTFSLQNSDGKWLYPLKRLAFMSTTDNESERAVFCAARAGPADVGIIRIKGDQSEAANMYCGVTDFYVPGFTVQDANNFNGDPLSRGGQILSGKWEESFYWNLTPRKLGLSQTPSLFFKESAPNSNATRFRLLFTRV